MPGVSGRGLQIASCSWSYEVCGVGPPPTGKGSAGIAPKTLECDVLRELAYCQPTRRIGSSLQTHRHLTRSGDTHAKR
jgi:hypothetical protein